MASSGSASGWEWKTAGSFRRRPAETTLRALGAATLAAPARPTCDGPEV